MTTERDHGAATGAIHRLYGSSFSVANAAAVAALTVTADDIGKVARAADTGALFFLASVGPSDWVRLAPATYAQVAAALAAATADVAFNGRKLTGLADPTSAQDAATRAYVLANVGTPIHATASVLTGPVYTASGLTAVTLRGGQHASSGIGQAASCIGGAGVGTNMAGGAAACTGGASTGTATAGAASCIGGAAGALGTGGAAALSGGAGGTPGVALVSGGDAVTDGIGGRATVRGGHSAGASQIGGDVHVTGGNGGSGNSGGGSAFMYGGLNSGTGTTSRCVLGSPFSGGSSTTEQYGASVALRVIPTVTTTGQTAFVGQLTRVSTASGSLATLNLPNATAYCGESAVIFKTSTDANTFTVKSFGGTVNGAAAGTGVAFGAGGRTLVRAYSDGTNWWVA